MTTHPTLATPTPPPRCFHHPDRLATHYAFNAESFGPVCARCADLADGYGILTEPIDDPDDDPDPDGPTGGDLTDRPTDDDLDCLFAN